MNREAKLMKMLDSLKRKLKNGMIGEFLRESSMLVKKFYCIGLVSDFLQENYSQNGRTTGFTECWKIFSPQSLSHHGCLKGPVGIPQEEGMMSTALSFPSV
jgi:hypothetical protein